MNSFQIISIMKRLLFIGIFAICCNCSSKQNKTVQEIPAFVSVDSLISILNVQVASHLNFEIDRNKCYFDVNDVVIVEPLYNESSRASGIKVGYSLNGVTAEKFQFYFDSISTKFVLEMSFPIKRFDIRTYNYGCFTRPENRVKHIGWMQPEKISVSFKPELLNNEPTLRFMELQLMRQTKLEKVKNPFFQQCYATIEYDIQESATKIFSSERIIQLFSRTLRPFAENLKHSSLFQPQEERIVQEDNVANNNQDIKPKQ